MRTFPANRSSRSGRPLVMDPATDSRRRRLLTAAIAGGIAMLLLVGVGVYGLLRGPATDDPAQPVSPTTSAAVWLWKPASCKPTSTNSTATS